MTNEVFAELEIDGNRVAHFSDIFLTQRFNDHHEFSLRVNHDVFEPFGSFSLDNSKNLIGKSAIIRFLENPVARQVAYEFIGIICEVGMVQAHSASGDLFLKGYSPTILLEDGPRLASFSDDNDKTLKDIVSQIISKADCATHVNPKLTSAVKYMCQYKESTFHFINRLSSDYGELFYYDGQTLVFGDPSEIEFVPLTYGEDLSSMQLNLHVEPIETVNYAYNSIEDDLMVSIGSETIEGLNEYASHVVQASNKLYSKRDLLPLVKSVDSENELKNFVNKNKESKAAGLVVLTGTSTNPHLFLGCVAEIIIPKKDEDFGIFLVTSITHHITANGKYYNTFEALSGWVRGIPVYNAARPIAEPQFGKVVANRDPSHLHRVRVKLEWQLNDETTPWIWVMTPDAGSGKDGAGGAGFVFTPEVGDRVLVGFEHNNPDMPFVLGSVFQGKSGKVSPTPSGQVPRCIKGRTTAAYVCIDDSNGSVNIGDNHKNYIILKEDGIWVQAHEHVRLFNFEGSASIDLSKDDITITGKNITIHATEKVTITGDISAIMKKDEGTYFKAEGSNADIQGNAKVVIGGPEIELNADTKLELKSGGTALLRGTGPTKVNGSPLDMNC